MSVPAVTIDQLSFQYASAAQPSLRDITLSFAPGEIALLIGPTGAGKSTLYLSLIGLIPNLIRGSMSGSVTVAGMDTSEHSIAELAQKVGIVFQDPEVQLFALTVEDELAFGPENLGLPKAEIVQRIRSAATIVQLQDLLEREPARLSGGQQQTVAIGSVWSMLPDVIILDEPTSNLDPQSTRRVLALIQTLSRQYGKTILIAEHNLDEVAGLVDRVFVMQQGQIVLDGSPQVVFGNPDRLHALGLAAPAATELAYALQQQGVDFDGPLPITLEQGLAALRKLRGRRTPAETVAAPDPLPPA
jgi:energy-coupling factor transport system ATP-binding protein